MIMGFLPWISGLIIGPFHLFLALLSWTDWLGFAKGLELTVLDAVALAVYLSLPRAPQPPPFRISMALYFVAVLLSVFQARVIEAALFYPWQLLRMYLIYAAVTRACAADPRTVRALMTGMVAGLFFETGDVIWERFALGLIQATGTAGHQNVLGMMSHFVVFPFFALLLARERGWLPAAATLAGVIVQLLTTSRATVGLAGFGYGTVFLLSAMRKWTSRKGQVLLIGTATLAVLAPVAISSFDRRFAVQDFGDYDERAAMERAAAMMLSDYPLGVGANQYVNVSMTEGYGLRAGIAQTGNSMTAHVHNVYWLVAAETGYLGLVTFVLLLLRPLTVAFLCGWRHRQDQRGDLLLGFGVALLVVYIHSFVEWAFITYEAQYMFALVLGMIAGLGQQLGYWRQPAAHRRHRNFQRQRHRVKSPQ
jgi:O-antigen ligase